MQIVWMELPVTDIERAVKFYSTVFQLDDVQINDDGTRKTAVLGGTGEEGAPGVSLTQVADFTPAGKSGIWVYLSAGEDMEGHAARVTAAGGAIVDANVSMGAAGSYTSFLDTENNLVALYAHP